MNKSRLLIFIVIPVLVVAFFVFWFFQKNSGVSREVSKLYDLQVSGKCDEVIPQAEEFLKTHDGAIDVWEKKAGCEFTLKRFSGAKQSYEKMLSIDPSSAVAKKYITLLSSPQEIAVDAAAKVGINIKDYGQMPPETFPKGIPLGNIEKVTKSSAFLKSTGDFTSPSMSTFIYTTKDTRKELSANLKSYFQSKGYVLPASDMKESTLATNFVAKKDAGPEKFTITINDNVASSTRYVSITYAFKIVTDFIQTKK